MNAADEFARDAKVAVVSYYSKPVGIALVLICVLVLAYVKGRGDGSKNVKVAAAKSEVARTVTIRETVSETVKVTLKAKTRTDTLVQVVTDTQVVIRDTPSAPPETVTVRPEIIERIEACDLFANACRRQLSADSAVIRAQANLIRELKPPKVGFKTGIVLGGVGAILLIKAIR